MERERQGSAGRPLGNDDMTNLRSEARPTGKVAIAGQGYLRLPKIADERCAVIEDGSGPWRSPPGKAAGGLLHRRRTTPGPQSGLAKFVGIFDDFREAATTFV